MESAYLLKLNLTAIPISTNGTTTESGHTAGSFQVIGSGSTAVGTQSSCIAGSGYTAQGTIAVGVVRFA